MPAPDTQMLSLGRGSTGNAGAFQTCAETRFFFFFKTYLNFKFGVLLSGASLGAVFQLNSGSCWSPVSGVMWFRVGTSASPFGKDGEGLWTNPALL